MPTRARPAAGGRTAAGQKKIPGLLKALRQLLCHETAGDPTNGRRWVRHSVRYLSAALRRQGYSVMNYGRADDGELETGQA